MRRLPHLREFFAVREGTPFSPQVQGASGPASMSGEGLSPEDARLARTIVQSVTQDLMSSGVEVGTLVSHLGGQMQLQDWNDLSQALTLWLQDNPGTGGRQAQGRMLQQKIRGMIGGYK